MYGVLFVFFSFLFLTRSGFDRKQKILVFVQKCKWLGEQTVTNMCSPLFSYMRCSSFFYVGRDPSKGKKIK